MSLAFLSGHCHCPGDPSGTGPVRIRTVRLVRLATTACGFLKSYRKFLATSPQRSTPARMAGVRGSLAVDLCRSDMPIHSRPGDLLSGRKATAILPALLRGSATARTILTRKRLRSIILNRATGNEWHRRSRNADAENRRQAGQSEGERRSSIVVSGQNGIPAPVHRSVIRSTLLSTRRSLVKGLG